MIVKKNADWTSSGNWYSKTEASWFHSITGLDAERKEDWAISEDSFKKALLNSDPDVWVYYFSLAGLERIKSVKLKQLKSEEDWARYKNTRNAFTLL